MTLEETKLWDRVAEETLHILSGNELATTNKEHSFKLARVAFDVADAFIEERRKRIENLQTFEQKDVE